MVPSRPAIRRLSWSEYDDHTIDQLCHANTRHEAANEARSDDDSYQTTQPSEVSAFYYRRVAVDPWVWWLVVALALAVAEVFTTFLVFGMLAIGAGAASLSAYLGWGIIGQSVVFTAMSLALLVLVRPIARRHLQMPPETRTGVDALIGRPAVVLERVDAHGGQVKLEGEIWSARAYVHTQVLEPGAGVDVVEIKGATALVYGPESP
jgi:membrane protein implicated in regulation of membrane protease activity